MICVLLKIKHKYKFFEKKELDKLKKFNFNFFFKIKKLDLTLKFLKSLFKKITFRFGNLNFLNKAVLKRILILFFFFKGIGEKEFLKKGEEVFNNKNIQSVNLL